MLKFNENALQSILYLPFDIYVPGENFQFLAKIATVLYFCSIYVDHAFGRVAYKCP